MEIYSYQKEIATVKFKQHIIESTEGKINFVYTVRGRECKDETETKATLVSIEDEKYAVQMEFKAGIVSDHIEERMVQDIADVEEEMMSFIMHN